MTFSLNLICDIKVFASHKNETIPLLVKNRICNSLAFLAELLLVLKDLGTERISPAALRSCFWCRRTWELNGFHWLRGFTKEADGYTKESEHPIGITPHGTHHALMIGLV